MNSHSRVASATGWLPPRIESVEMVSIEASDTTPSTLLKVSSDDALSRSSGAGRAWSIARTATPKSSATQLSE